MSQPKILLYNFTDQDRLRQIRRYLNRHHIQVNLIKTNQFLDPLGYLFQIPGFSPNPSFNLSGNFTEEMMVMESFSQQQLQDFLSFFHENGLTPVALKSILTPVNIHWSSLKLYQELSKEHRSFSVKK